MAQRLSTSFVNTNIPGAYPSVTVKSTPVGITNTGDIVIIGEAEGGADYTQETLKENFFTPTQLSRVKAKYLSGPIVDAMAALTSPSNDTNITGSIGRVYVIKTNAGTQASAIVEGDSSSYGTLKDKNYGKDGNKYSYEIINSEDESAPEITSGVIASFGATLDGLEFKIRVDGGAEVTITLGVGGHADRDELVTELDGLLAASGLSCLAGTAADTIKIQYDSDANANEKGYGKSFELINSNPGDLAAISLTESLSVSSQEPEIEVSIVRQDTNTNEKFIVESEVALTIGYDGTSASLDISGGVLSTTVVGGVGGNLSINLAEYTTMADLAAFITSQAGYSATSIASSNNLSPLRLDEVSGVGIASATYSYMVGMDTLSFGGEEPGRIKKASDNFKSKLSQSSVVDFEETLKYGLPAETTGKIFLSDGTKGSTSAADIANAMTDLEGIKVNFVIPLFSKDASDDIADGLTDSGSTYTIDAINALVKSHCLAMSTVKLKRNRIAMLSKDSSYLEVKQASSSLSSFRVNFFTQKSSQVDSLGNVVEYQPWHTACIAAGMQSAGFNRSLTNKFANVISFKDPSGFDSGNPGDVEDAIDAGLFFLQTETAGSKWVVDQTTYGFDTNFVYNSLQAVYMADVLAIQLSESLENFAVGKSLADINSASVAAFISKKMEEFRKLKIIGPSDDAPLGYKNVTISINGPIAEVKLEVKLATAILFIPIEIELSQIQSSTNA
jgi:hypothetical protein